MKKSGILLMLINGLIGLTTLHVGQLQAQTSDTLRLEFGNTQYCQFRFAATPGTYYIKWGNDKETRTIESTDEWRDFYASNLTGDHTAMLIYPEKSTEHITKFQIYNTSLTAIDASGCPNLTYLDCSNTQLTALDVSQNTALSHLDCSSTPLTDLDVSKNTALSHLDCASTQLTDLDVSGLTNLTTLNCANHSGRHLKTLNVSGCTALTELDCSSTQLSNLDVSGLTNLTALNAYGASLVTLNAAGCTSLSSLNCAHCYNREDEPYNSRCLKSLDLSGCTALKTLDCQYSNLTALVLSDCRSLETLTCYESPLEVLSVSNCENLQYLNCHNNQLSFLNLSGCRALTYLNCHYSYNLTELDLSNNPDLETVLCYDSYNMERLNVSGCTKLTDLTCYNSRIRSLDLSTNMALQNLDCRSSHYLTDLDLSQHTALISLNCSNNSMLTELNLTGCTKLSSVEAAGIQAIELDFSDLKALSSINCNENNSLKSIQLTGCDALVYLAIKNTQLHDIDLSPCPNFRELYCLGSRFSLQTLAELAPQARICALSPQVIKKTCIAGEAIDLRDEFKVSGTNGGETTFRVLMDDGSEALPEYYKMGEGDDYGLITLKKLGVLRIELRNADFVNKDGQTIDPLIVNYDVNVIGQPDYLDRPYFSEPEGDILLGTKVSIFCAYVDADIYYTLDETDPRYNGMLYDRPIAIRDDLTIRAYAILGSVQSEISEISYTVRMDMPEAPDTIAPPTFSVPGGAVERGTQVEIFCEASPVRIYYTLDGSEPTAGSHEYTEPIVINGPCMLKAFAISLSQMSSVASVYYTIKGEDPNAPVVAAPIFSLPGGEVKKGTTVRLSCATEGAKIYYRADGSDPSDQSWEYTTPIVINNDMTLKAIAIVADQKSEVTTAIYSVVEESKPVAAPTFSHPSGDVKKGTKISLSCVTEGATIYYTLDGSTPNRQSTVFDDAIDITGLTLIKAIAIKDQISSDESMAVYTLKTSNTPGNNDDDDDDERNVATPQFSHLSGELETGTSVYLTCATKGAQIYYTTDGSTPTRMSLKYKGPIAIFNFTIIKAVAIKGNEYSLEAMAFYTVPTANETESPLAGTGVYPNPNSGTFYVELPVAATVEILTANGMPVRRLELGAGSQPIQLNQSGLYILRITAEGATSIQRVMVR